MATWPEFDPEPALRTLSRGGVDFVVVGGIAAVLHGASTLTTDLDIAFAADSANLGRLGAALEELEARLRDVPEPVPFVPDARTLRQVELLTLDTRTGPLDLIRVPAGGPGYAILRRRANRYDLGGYEVRVASIEDLIAMKHAAGRAKDLAAIEELEAILRLRGR
jgi:hypothetical protein